MFWIHILPRNKISFLHSTKFYVAKCESSLKAMRFLIFPPIESVETVRVLSVLSLSLMCVLGLLVVTWRRWKPEM